MITAPLGKPVDPEVNIIYAGFTPVISFVSFKLSSLFDLISISNSSDSKSAIFIFNSLHKSFNFIFKSESVNINLGRQVENIFFNLSTGLSKSITV